MENINLNQRLTEIVEKIAKGKEYLAPGIVVAVDSESKARVKVRIPHMHGYCDAEGNNCDDQVIENDSLPYIKVPLLKSAPPGVQNAYEKYFKGDHVRVRIEGDDPSNWEVVTKIKPLPGMGGKEKENIQNSLVTDKLVQECEGSFVTDSPEGRDCCTVITESAKIKQNGENVSGADRCGSGGKLKDGITAEIADFMKIVQSTNGKIGTQFVSNITGELFSMASYIQKYTASILGVLRSAINWIKAIITKYARQAIDALVKAIMVPIKGVTKVVDDTIEQILQMIACSFGNLEALLQNLLEGLLNSLLDSALNAIWGCLDPLIDGIINTILSEISSLLNSILSAISSIAGLIAPFGDMLGEALNAILDYLGISCGGAGDCTATGQATMISKFNSPGEYGMTFGISKALNTGLSAIDGITSGIVTGVNGIDAAVAAGNSFAAGVSLGTSDYPGIDTSNAALVRAFSVAEGALGPSVSSVFDFCDGGAGSTTAVILGTDLVSNYMVTASAGGVCPTGSGITFNVTRDNTEAAGAINVVAYKSSVDTIRLDGSNRDIDFTNFLTNADFIDGDPSNPFDIINSSVAFTTASGSHIGTNVFYSKRLNFGVGENAKSVYIPTRTSSPTIVGYTTPGIYLDLTSTTGTTTVTFSLSDGGGSTNSVNIPGPTATGGTIPPLTDTSGASVAVNLIGGRVYGPITGAGGGTLYLGNEVVAGISGSGSLSNQHIVIAEGTDDWDDFVVRTSHGVFVNATSTTSFASIPTEVTFRVSLFRNSGDISGYDHSDGRNCSHFPNTSSALNTAVGRITFASTAVPAAAPSGAAPAPAPSGVPPAGSTSISYFSTTYSVTAGNPVLMNITRMPDTASASTIRYTISGITAINGVHFDGGTLTGTINFDPASAPPTGGLRVLSIPTFATPPAAALVPAAAPAPVNVLGIGTEGSNIITGITPAMIASVSALPSGGIGATITGLVGGGGIFAVPVGTTITAVNAATNQITISNNISSTAAVPAPVPIVGAVSFNVVAAAPAVPVVPGAFPPIPSSGVTFNVNIRDEVVPALHTSTLGTAPGANYVMTIFPSGVVVGGPAIGPATCAAAINFTATPPTCMVQPDTSPLSLGVIATTTVAGYTLSYQWQRTYTPSNSGSWTNISDGVFNTTVPVATPTPIILASGVTPSGIPFVISGWTTTIINTPASCGFSGATSPTLTVSPISHLINDQEYYRCAVLATPTLPSLITPFLPIVYSPNTYVGVNASGVFSTTVNCSPVPPSGGVIVYSGAAPVASPVPLVASGFFCGVAPIPGFPASPPPIVIPSGVAGPIVLPVVAAPVPPAGPAVVPSGIVPSPGVPAGPAGPVAPGGVVAPPPPPAPPVGGGPAPALPFVGGPIGSGSPGSGAYVTTPVVGPGGGVVSVPIPPGLPAFAAPPMVAITGGGFGAVAKTVLNERGYVDRIIVTSAGFGYSPNKGEELCGILENIEITAVGGYYESSPTVYVDGDSDVAFASIDEQGRVVDIRITNPKNKVYDYIPTIELRGGGGLGASAIAVIRYVNCADVADEYLNVVDKYNTRRIGTVRIVDCP